MAKSKQEPLCPCGLGPTYESCCGRYISGAELAPDAEALMRSRYTAYTLENEVYLQKSWHPSTRLKEVMREQDSCKWISLKVLSHHQEQLTATVEFIAKYKINGRAEQLHETSRFVCEGGQWLYKDGVFSK
ncbi:YchJ family protein [Solimicrobium silvestre]|uniref:YchJ-like middle NTF2-like domain-containing protein n=1 Tax=Solimicrobium silvestre TaxID=2099400 RepID=A0A2S9H043_9BURK|nr:YchJ family metal-binding protein [Solimicrobium silvestre]PRC93337.1 hypothetical protein S2091_2075 [Solimicrobium silvestre]